MSPAVAATPNWPRSAASALRVGVIGANGRGTMVDHSHCPEKGVTVVCGMDITEEAREKFKRRIKDKFNCDVNTYSDYKEMFDKENLDVVFVTSPDFLHEEHAIYALEHGVAVYLEKPMALTIDSADRILNAAYQSRTPLFVGHNMRYMNFTRAMKSLIDADTIGTVKAVWCRHFISYGGDAYFYDWHADRKNSNSLFLQKGCHDIDIIHWLASGITTRTVAMGGLGVYGELSRRPAGELDADTKFNETHWPPLAQGGLYPVVDVEDLGQMMMYLDNGVFASYQQCHYTPDCDRNYTVLGTKGRLENFGERVEVWINRHDCYRPEGDITIRAAADSGGHGGADPKIVKSFIDSLRGKYDLWVRPQAARASVAAGDSATISMRSQSVPVDIKPLAVELEKYDYIRCVKL